MKLATIRTSAGTVLCVATEDGLVEVDAAAAGLPDVRDVGSLLAAGPEALAQLRAWSAGMQVSARAQSEVGWAPPIAWPSKIICIGLNYRRHAAEGGVPVPDSPIIFAKFPNSLIGSGEAIRFPKLTSQLDYEGELAVVIGKRVRDVSEHDAVDAVAGYMCANDVSARDLQHGLPGEQWVYGKTLDGFCPTGPFFVSADEVGDWRDIRIQTRVNDELRQDEVCADMVFGVEQLIAYIAAGITLEPGDVILTGTPSGVGLGYDPPRWLRPGDRVDIELTGLGRLSSTVASV